MGTGEEDGILTTKNTDTKVTKDLTMRDPLVVTLLLLAGVSGHARQSRRRHLLVDRQMVIERWRWRKLKATTGAVDVIVIDSVSAPTPD